MIAPTAPPRVSRLELAAAGLTLLMLAEAFLPRLLAPPSSGIPGDVPESTLLRLLWLPFYALIGVGLLLVARRSWYAIIRSPWLIVLSLLAIASTVWSIDPELTFRRGIAVLATTLMGIYLAARLDWHTALRLLASVWFALMLASFVSGIVAPSFAVMSEVHPGAWMGGWSEKNALGGHAARATFLFAFMAWRDTTHRRLWTIGLILAAALVLLSRSTTALLGMLLGAGVLIGAWWALKGRRHALALAWTGLTAFGLFVIVILLAPGLILSAFGKDATLTGRTDIWVELAAAIEQKPMLGYGYLAFWGLDSEPRYWLGKAVAWNAPSGHNGWLDLAISLGLVGVAIFAIDVGATVWRGVRLALRSPAGVFALGFLAQFMLFGMSESIILAQNSILWATFSFVSAKLALDSEGRVQSHTPQSAAPSVGGASTAPASAARWASSSIKPTGAP